MFNSAWLALLAIPPCIQLNHLGGQSVDIPNPRIVCRVIGIPIAIFIVSLLCGLPIESSALLWAIDTAGFALWAVFKWGPMFMVFNGEDHRDYTSKWYQTNRYITLFCDKYMGLSQYSKLTAAQAKEWGMIYGTIRGAFMYPLFFVLSIMLTPWAMIIGFSCFLQGIIYRYSSSVLQAEYFFGALIGTMFSAILMICAWGV